MSKVENNNIKWLFLGGCPRSGTTMLNFLLNRHSQIFLANEQNIYKTIVRSDELFYREDHLQARVDRTKSTRESTILIHTKDEQNRATIRRSASQKSLIQNLFTSSLLSENMDNLAGTIYIGDKFPLYYTWDFNRITSIIPEFKIIHISRAPLDAINSIRYRSLKSKKKEDWFEKSISEAIFEWIRAWNFINEYSNSINFIHLRYEDLCANPKSSLAELEHFLELESPINHDGVAINESNLSSLSKSDIRKVYSAIPKDLVEWKLPLNEQVQAIPKIDQIEIPYSFKDLKSNLRRRIRNF